LAADCDLRIGHLVELFGKMFEVLADAGLLDMEALRVAPMGDITGDENTPLLRLFRFAITKLPPIQRIREEHLDRIALVGAIAASIRAKVATLFERIELRVGDVDRPATDAPALPPAKCLHP
jgi:hypothetical protein